MSISKRIMSRSKRQSVWAGTMLCSFFLLGCAVGPEFVKPESGLDQALLAPRDEHSGSAQTVGTAVPSEWWNLFNDEQLTRLQLLAQENNLDLQIAASRIDESRAQLGIISAELLPTYGGSASYAREANSEHGKVGALGAPSNANNFYQLGLDASWEIDLWGRARRANEGAEASLQVTVFDREMARVALSAEIARNYLQLRGIQAQIAIAQQSVTIAERTVGLAHSRERNGVASRFELSSARAHSSTVRASIPELSQRRSALLNGLALLLGEQPRALDKQLREAMPLPSLPLDVPVGLSSELARRRPDIRRAEAQLHAATAAIGVAHADFYPRVGLKGRLGLEAFESRDLSSWDARFFSFGPSVYLPIFQGGRLTQRLKLSEARQKSAAIAYRKTVLNAWHEVDNALDAWAAQQREHGELTAALSENRQALHVAERGYMEGASDYLSVLTAQRNVLTSQASLNTSATNATLTLVNLYKALGGGWSPTEALLNPAGSPTASVAELRP